MKQNNCKIIGLTGGIATGKSTVTKFLIDKGFKVIDADKIARKVVEINTPAYKDIVNQFGSEILKDDLTIDRKKLGSIIFNDNKKREKLNSIVHPRIFQYMRDLISKYNEIEKVIFLDIPLLIEELEELKKYNINTDEIWLVYTNQNNQIERLKKRDGFTYEDAKKRINSQMPMKTKKKYATKIINNNDGIEELKNTIQNIVSSLK